MAVRLAGPSEHVQVIRAMVITKNTYNNAAYPMVATTYNVRTLMVMAGTEDTSRWLVQGIATPSHQGDR